MALLLAEKLGLDFLDSGALYRLLALAALNNAIDLANEKKLADLALTLDIKFVADEPQKGARVLLSGVDVTREIRTEKTAAAASKIAALPKVRAALLQKQRDFAGEKGLVADGRDMGTVVFPDATYKFFLDASPEQRALRRAKQLNIKQDGARIRALKAEIEDRDLRDRTREVAPLKAATDSIIIDTSDLSIDEVLTIMLGIIK